MEHAADMAVASEALTRLTRGCMCTRYALRCTVVSAAYVDADSSVTVQSLTAIEHLKVLACLGSPCEGRCLFQNHCPIPHLETCTLLH